MIEKNEALNSVAKVFVSPLFPKQTENYYRPIPFALFSLVGQETGFHRAGAFQALHLFFVVILTGSVFAFATHFFPFSLAFWITLLFVLFPTNLESLAWLSGFPDTLVIILWAWFALRLQADSARKSPSLVTLAILLVALLCKEGAVGFLPYAFLVDWKNLSRARLFSFHAPIWMTFAFYFLIHKLVLSYTPPFLGNVNLSLKTLWAYVEKSLFPLPLSIVIGERTLNFEWEVVAGGAVGVLLLWLILQAKDHRLRVGAALFVSGYLPYSNAWLPLGDSYLIAERYMGPMVLGLLIIAATILANTKPRLIHLSSAGLALVFFSICYSHYAAWREPKRLFEEAADLFPDKISLVNRLTGMAIAAGDWGEAQVRFEKTITNITTEAERFQDSKAGPIYLENMATPFDRGRQIYFQTGDFEKALKYARLHYPLSKQPVDALFGVSIQEHLLDVQSSLTASITGNKTFPTHSGLATSAIQRAVFNGAESDAWDVVNRSSYRYQSEVMAALQKREAFSKLSQTEQASSFFDMGLLSLAYVDYNKAITEMTASDLNDAGLRAYHERIWAQSERFINLALLKEPTPERFGWLGLAQQKLGRPQEACRSYAMGILKAGATHDNQAIEMLRQLNESCLDAN